jgi:hypothetical protein
MQPAPEGVFTSTVDGLRRIIAREPNPIEFARSLLRQLSEVKDEGDLERLKLSSPEVKKFGDQIDWNKLGAIASIISAIIAVLSLGYSLAQLSPDQIIDIYKRGANDTRSEMLNSPSVSPQTQPSKPQEQPDRPKKRQGSHMPPKSRNLNKRDRLRMRRPQPSQPKTPKPKLPGDELT